MVLYLSEYLNYLEDVDESIKQRNRRIQTFRSGKKYLHEMSADEILKATTVNGGDSVYPMRIVVASYLKWLLDMYAIDVTPLLYVLDNSKADNVYIGVFDIADLRKTIEIAMNQYEFDFENDIIKASIIEQNAKTLFFLEWYGINYRNALSIYQSDVKSKGKTIYVPSFGVDVDINDAFIADYIYNWSKETEVVTRNSEKTIELKGDKLLRSTHGNLAVSGTNKVYASLKNPKLKRNAVLKAGIYSRLYSIELEQGSPINEKNNSEQIKRLFYVQEMEHQKVLSIIRSYNGYKDAYIEYLRNKK